MSRIGIHGHIFIVLHKCLKISFPRWFLKTFSTEVWAHEVVRSQPGAASVGCFKALSSMLDCDCRKVSMGLRIWKVLDSAGCCQFAFKPGSRNFSFCSSSHGFIQTYNDVTDINLPLKAVPHGAITERMLSHHILRERENWEKMKNQHIQ